jgi:serine/threonine-protein kinase mTOR
MKSLLPDPDINIMHAASRTLGVISKIGGAAFGEHFMEFEVQAAIELIRPLPSGWSSTLSSSSASAYSESSRYAGVLILKELARNSPNHFYSHVGLVLENVLIPLQDPRPTVRESAAELLAACLVVLTLRERHLGNNPFVLKILSDAQNGLQSSQPEIINRSLLIYRELLLHGGMVGANIT